MFENEVKQYIEIFGLSTTLKNTENLMLNKISEITCTVYVKITYTVSSSSFQNISGRAIEVP